VKYFFARQLRSVKFVPYLDRPNYSLVRYEFVHVYVCNLVRKFEELTNNGSPVLRELATEDGAARRKRCILSASD